MRKLDYRPYFLLLLLVFSALSLPSDFTQRIRSATVLSLAPSWRSVDFVKRSLAAVLPGSGRLESSPSSLQWQQLQQEHQILRSQMESVRSWLGSQEVMQQQIEKLRTLPEAAGEEDFIRRRNEHLAAKLESELYALPGKVIFREPASWSSSVWINLGEKDNQAVGKTVIAKNSPVIVGHSIVGIVEHIGWRQCRARLITDTNLVPSVRAVRGGEQERFLIEHIDALLAALGVREDLAPSKDAAQIAFQTLLNMKQHLLQQPEERFLAKGELYGSSYPLWRARSQELRGVGFNYDFADEEGPARDLRLGNPLDAQRSAIPEPLLQQGDLLVTTGLDGVFPPGFRVAMVTKIFPLREGGCSYEIRALPTAGDLSLLSDVLVLPPIQEGSTR